MTLRPLVLAFATIFALAPAANAATYTYHGDLMDGDAPAEGRWDLRVRALGSATAGKSLAPATELPAVVLDQGRFSVEFELPEDVDGSTWVEVALRRAGSADEYVVMGAPQPLAKVNSTCPGAWALDGNSGAPPGAFLGYADARTLFINAPGGTGFNTTTAQVNGSVDVRIGAKSSGDADADLVLESRGGRTWTQYVRDTDGNIVSSSATGAFSFFDGVARGIQNDGRSVFDFSGRLRSTATGSEPGDSSGGIWLDDENADASFLGRGNNDSDWTGVFAANAWRMVVTDSGQLLLNTTVPTTASDDVVLKAAAGSTDFDLVLATQAGPSATILVSDVDGALRLDATRIGLGRAPFANKLEVAGTASKTTAGDWLANSDRRIKQEIEPVGDAIGTLMKLRPVTFRYTPEYRVGKDEIADARYYNVIAQEFAEVFPDAVKPSGEYLAGLPKTAANAILQVDTYPAQIVTMAAVQELVALDALQDESLAAMQAELAAVRRDNAALAAQVERLLALLDRATTRGE